MDIGSTYNNKMNEITGRFESLFSGNKEKIFRAITNVILTIVVLAVFNAVFRYLFNLFNTKGAEALVRTMRNRLFSHIQHLPFSWHMKNDGIFHIILTF